MSQEKGFPQELQVELKDTKGKTKKILPDNELNQASTDSSLSATDLTACWNKTQHSLEENNRI